MKEYLLPEKFIRRVYNTDLTMSLIVITCGITSGLYKFDFTTVLMLLMGLLSLTMVSVRANNITYKVVVTDEFVEFIAKKDTRKIYYKEIVRFSYKRKIFKTKSISGLFVFDNNSYGYIDLRINNSNELIEYVLTHCSHLDTKELLKIILEHKIN